MVSQLGPYGRPTASLLLARPGTARIEVWHGGRLIARADSRALVVPGPVDRFVATTYDQHGHQLTDVPVASLYGVHQPPHPPAGWN